MKIFFTILLSILIFSCAEKPKDLIVKANIIGLKKGTVYLKKKTDTSLIVVDSVIVHGESPIELYSALEEPDIYYLVLKKNVEEEDHLLFFADKGVTTISTTLKNYTGAAIIRGSKQQLILQDYQKLMSRLNNRNLELIKENFEAQKSKDSILLNAIKTKQTGIIKAKYLQTVNFAINNNDSEVSPYLALSEIYDAKLSLLDTIHASLTPKIQNSKYGVKLKHFINERKDNNY